MIFYNVFLDVVCAVYWPQYFPWGLLTCPFLGNLFARKVLYYEYLDFVANQIHYYFDLVMLQGKYYISLPKLIMLVTFWHVMKTRSCQAYLTINGTNLQVKFPGFWETPTKTWSLKTNRKTPKATQSGREGWGSPLSPALVAWRLINVDSELSTG